MWKSRIQSEEGTPCSRGPAPQEGAAEYIQFPRQQEDTSHCFFRAVQFPLPAPHPRLSLKEN